MHAGHPVTFYDISSAAVSAQAECQAPQTTHYMLLKLKGQLSSAFKHIALSAELPARHRKPLPTSSGHAQSKWPFVGSETRLGQHPLPELGKSDLRRSCRGCPQRGANVCYSALKLLPVHLPGNSSGGWWPPRGNCLAACFSALVCDGVLTTHPGWFRIKSLGRPGLVR